MSLIRNNPWDILNSLQRELYNPDLDQLKNNAQLANTSWAPSVDISENEKAFSLHADIPGVNPDEIEISMERGVLTIKGERNSEKVEEGEKFRRVERQRGSFSRSFTLPDNVDTDNIEAACAHGVLTVTIPKQEAAVSRRIEIKH
jgi:HSP20 family protein